MSNRKSKPESALDYPRVDNRLFIIWNGNGVKWPDARRETHYLSATRADVMKGYALFTMNAGEAKTFETESDAQAWLAENNAKRPNPYRVTVSTVAAMKVACGYGVPTIDAMRADTPHPGHSAEWHFFRSYVGAALWSTNDESDPETGGEPMDSNYDISDLVPETLESMLTDCAAFYTANGEHIHCEDAPCARDFDGSIAAREAAQAGHDFWLTRCGHGAGFWDGDWPEPHATALDDAARAFGETWLYVGDDGRIHS